MLYEGTELVCGVGWQPWEMKVGTWERIVVLFLFMYGLPLGFGFCSPEKLTCTTTFWCSFTCSWSHFDFHQWFISAHRFMLWLLYRQILKKKKKWQQCYYYISINISIIIYKLLIFMSLFIGLLVKHNKLFLVVY